MRIADASMQRKNPPAPIRSLASWVALLLVFGSSESSGKLGLASHGPYRLKAEPIVRMASSNPKSKTLSDRENTPMSVEKRSAHESKSTEQ